MATSETEGLSPKQERFVKEYLIDLNGAQAAIRAGYSANSAKEQASRLLTNDNIKAAIEAGQKSAAEKLGITHERVLTEMARLAFLDIRKAFDDEGNLIPITELDDDTAAAISGLDVEEKRVAGSPIGTRTSKIKLSDKRAALESLGKHVGLFADKAKVDLNLTGGVNFYLPENGRD